MRRDETRRDDTKNRLHKNENKARQGKARQDDHVCSGGGEVKGGRQPDESGSVNECEFSDLLVDGVLHCEFEFGFDFGWV